MSRTVSFIEEVDDWEIGRHKTRGKKEQYLEKKTRINNVNFTYTISECYDCDRLYGTLFTKDGVALRHKNFVHIDERKNVSVLSLRRSVEAPIIMVILRSATQSSVLFGTFQLTSKSSPAHENKLFDFPELFAKCLVPTWESTIPFEYINDVRATDVILETENFVYDSKTFKIGVLVCKEGQTNENDIFSNCFPTPDPSELSPPSSPPPLRPKITHSQLSTTTSTPLYKLLVTLGDVIKLKGFSAFNGGLDILNGLTGEESIFTEHSEAEIMFHVSSLMPFSENCEQQVARKRYIGNDMVCIVFLEGKNAVFNPTWISSNLLHAYMVIRYEKGETDDEYTYYCSITFKTCLERDLNFPILYEAHIRNEDDRQDFRKWVLDCLIRLEIFIYRAPGFAKMSSRGRSLLMNQRIPELTTQPVGGTMGSAILSTVFNVFDFGFSSTTT